jgi:hypothetical protein
MRGLLLSAVMLFGVAAPAAARRGAAIPHHAKPGPILVVEATGEVKSMTLKQITVGRVTCALGPNAARAARFVITDPVTITCRAGTLQKIRYAPPRSQSTTAAGEVAPLAATARPHTPGALAIGECRETVHEGGLVTRLCRVG